MIALIRRARKHVGNAAADHGADDAEGDRPEERYVDVHYIFRDNPRNQADKKIPDQVKHAFSPSFDVGVLSSSPGPAMSRQFQLSIRRLVG
jgi:hypothetical protein